VRAIYKRKAEKVRPVDSHESDSSTLGGRPDWKERAIRRQLLTVLVRELGPYDYLFKPKYILKPISYRLTPKRLKDVLQVPTYSVPRTLRQKLIEMLQERINIRILKPYYGPYRNL
ncbi:MAG: hypothetical protein FE78DRAFT_541738, partial [Acidomyces sp. 'richmondensis']